MKDRFDPLPPIVGAGFLALFAWLWTTHPAIYHRALAWWIGTPFDHPFLDTQFITAGVRCWAQGVNVYDGNPCDPLDRPHNYSPLFLRLTFLPTDDSALPWLGVGLVAAFLVAVGFLPRLRRLSDRLWLLLAVLSPPAAFAAERGNLDLAIFVLLVIAGWCLGGRLPARCVGYGAVILAALLKFYPAVSLALVLRERLKAAIAIAIVTSLVLAGFVGAYRAEVARALANMPQSSPFADVWGAKILPAGVNDLLPAVMDAVGWHGAWLVRAQQTHMVAGMLYVTLLAVSVASALWMAFRAGMAETLAALSPRAGLFLAIGALLQCGCFFAGESASYRSIDLLFALPAVLMLARTSRLFRCTAGAILLVLWVQPVRDATAWLFGGAAYPLSGSFALYAVWFVQELIWWWLFAVLLAVLVRFCWDSVAWRDVRGAPIAAGSGAS